LDFGLSENFTIRPIQNPKSKTMAQSKCGNCGFEYFEVVKNKPQNFETDLLLVQCASCGMVIGLVNESPTESIIKSIEDQFLKIQEITTTLDHNIRVIAGKFGIR
jgi:uncharacterized Zn finger protein